MFSSVQIELCAVQNEVDEVLTPPFSQESGTSDILVPPPAPPSSLLPVVGGGVDGSTAASVGPTAADLVRMHAVLEDALDDEVIMDILEGAQQLFFVLENVVVRAGPLQPLLP